MNPTVGYFGSFAIGIGVGGMIGVFVGRYYFKKKFEKQADEQIADVKERYKRIRVTEDKTPEQMYVEKGLYSEKLAELQYADKDEEEPNMMDGLVKWAENGSHDPRPPVNIFTDEETEENQEEVIKQLVKDRPTDGETPFFITVDEYHDNDLGYDQETVTYFEEDDTLCGPDNVIIAAVEEVIGRDALGRFGLGSDEKHMTYVRNPRIETDYEVVRVENSYVEVILGYKDEQKEITKREMKKWRTDD